MQLKKYDKQIKILDPFNNFNEVLRTCEIRFCPLSNRISRIIGLSSKNYIKKDYSNIIEESKKICPFCPELIDKITPKFTTPLNETYTFGQARCFPNAFPYDENNAVVVISHDHFTDINNFNTEQLFNAFLCSKLFFNDIDIKKYPYISINWNYMPDSGSSLVHPHMQVIASNTPSNYVTDIINKLKDSSTNIFSEYTNHEKELNERYITNTGNIDWLIAFAPFGQFDILGIFNEIALPDSINDDLLNEISYFFIIIFRFFDKININSFNMSLFFVCNNKGFYPHIRITPRLTFPPNNTSEINYLQMLHKDSLSLIKPEEITNQFKEFLSSI